MRQELHPKQQAANVLESARAFGIQPRALYQAIKDHELQTFTVRGVLAVLLFSDVERWLKTHPTKGKDHGNESAPR